MDKQLQQPKYKKLVKTVGMLFIGTVIATTIFNFTDKQPDKISQTVSAQTLSSSAVLSGHFADKLRLRASISWRSC